MRSWSTRTVARSFQGSSTRTRMSSSPATGATSSAAASPARHVGRSPPPAAVSPAAFARRVRRPTSRAPPTPATAASRGARVPAQLRVRSPGHRVFVDEAGADGRAAAGVVATLLPSAAFYRKLGRFAPARMLIERGVAVAIATDVNPGGGFSPSMPFAIALACFGMGLTFEEALVGATLNGAYSLDRHARVGSLEPGKQMDAVVVDGPAIDLIRVGAETIAHVIKKGRLV